MAKWKLGPRNLNAPGVVLGVPPDGILDIIQALRDEALSDIVGDTAERILAAQPGKKKGAVVTDLSEAQHVLETTESILRLGPYSDREKELILLGFYAGQAFSDRELSSLTARGIKAKHAKAKEQHSKELLAAQRVKRDQAFAEDMDNLLSSDSNLSVTGAAKKLEKEYSEARLRGDRNAPDAVGWKTIKRAWIDHGSERKSGQSGDLSIQHGQSGDLSM
jgi:hypothetical protein